MADGIEKLRREIDALDDELLALVNRRATLAQNGIDANMVKIKPN